MTAAQKNIIYGTHQGTATRLLNHQWDQPEGTLCFIFLLL